MDGKQLCYIHKIYYDKNCSECVKVGMYSIALMIVFLSLTVAMLISCAAFIVNYNGIQDRLWDMLIQVPEPILIIVVIVLAIAIVFLKYHGKKVELGS